MFTLDQVVPWGRSFDEYSRMFSLGRDDLAGRILGCGDGPASLNAEAARRGMRVVSCDPIYQFDASLLRRRIVETADQIIEQTRRNADEFVWDTITSIDELRDTRMSAMTQFLEDFSSGTAAGRYIAAELTNLPFAGGAFDLVLSSHFLFLYTTQLGEAFHIEAVREMCRVAGEVRIFPLLALGGAPSPHVAPVTDALAGAGFRVSIEQVPYEFQRGGNRMMRAQRIAFGNER